MMSSDRLLGAVRFVVITFALAGTYLLLQHAQLSIFRLVNQKWFSGFDQAALSSEANDVAVRSAAAEARLPQRWRRDVFELGLHAGFVAKTRGLNAVVERDDPPLLENMAQSARKLADAMGVGPAAWPSAVTEEQASGIARRFEDDETGLAGRIESKLSLRHRHLYLAGVHAGFNAAVVLWSRGETFFEDNATLLARHATLAGLPAASWQDLTRAPEGATPDAKLAYYRSAIAVLERAIASAAPSMPPPAK